MKVIEPRERGKGMETLLRELFKAQRQYFDKGNSKKLLFRIRSLRALKKSVQRKEKEIIQALEKDLSKPDFESFSAELAMFYEEVNYAIDKVRAWSRPEKKKTLLVLEPAKSWIQPEPKGVVLIVGPWNYPFQLVMVPLVGAIAAGNCAMIKPSDKTHNTSDVITAIIQETFDPEYITSIQGPGSEVGNTLVERFSFDHIFFTGSTETGKKIMAKAAAHLTPVTLELGGKSPAIVMDDAKLDVTARRIAWGKFMNAGQTCIAPDYVLVHEAVKEKLIDELSCVIGDFYGKDPLQSKDYGRIVNQQRFDKLLSFLKEGNVRRGGNYDREKLFIAPTIMDEISLENRVMKEEIFGPILPVLSFQNSDDVISIVRKNRNPLALYLFTENKKNEGLIFNQLEFGGGCINNCIIHVASQHLPFGGVKTSGMGRYHGKDSFDTFSNYKSVVRSATSIDPSIKYPPYDRKNIQLLKKLL